MICKMKKMDFLLIILLLVIFGILPLTLFGNVNRNSIVYAAVDGKTIATFDINSDKELKIETEYGMNVIKIKDRKVCISDADCPNHECIKMGSISNSYKRIICLPHHLDIYISGDSLNIDGVSY